MSSETLIGSGTDHSKYNAVYEKSTPEIYDEWAKDGYNELAGDFARGSLESVSSKSLQHLAYTKLKVIKTLDAGCGTGNVAEVCNADLEKKKVSFKYEWYGLDFSEGMLEIARQKEGLYKDLVQGDLKKTLSYADETFDLIVSVGTFLQGHVGSEAVPELCRILKPKGLMVFTVRPQLFEDTKESWLSELSKGGMNILGIDSMPYAKDMNAPVISCIKGPIEMKVSSKKGMGFYSKAVSSFLTGVAAQAATDGKEAKEAKLPVEELAISGLGEAINVTVAVAARAESDGLATVSKIVTEYPEMQNGRGCAQIVINVRKKK